VIPSNRRDRETWTSGQTPAKPFTNPAIPTRMAATEDGFELTSAEQHRLETAI
jgi:hypothetical protein